MDRVTVFRFKLEGGETDTNALFPRAATAERIRQIQDAIVVEESAHVVDSHCVDSQGFLIDEPSCSEFSESHPGVDAGQIAPRPLP